jgi:site-specific DNA-methyltransferase (adenine-specific)
VVDITSPATPAAREWSGWGTALKPAWEPVILARRPIEGTVAANVLKYGTGGINVDGCRVGTEDVLSFGSRELGDGIKYGKCKPTTEGVQNPRGRWPANVLHDGSAEVLAGFPETGAAGDTRATGGITAGKSIWGIGSCGVRMPKIQGDNGGSAARFFYTAKASRRDRGEHNTHPTVKPFKLIRYLTRFVSRRGALVLDPFAGSGTLAVVCEHLRRRWVCIEKEEAHCAIAVKRIEAERRQMKLF